MHADDFHASAVARHGLAEGICNPFRGESPEALGRTP